MSAGLAVLAALIEEQLADELASRQQIAERALAGIRELAARPAPAALTEEQGVVLGQVLADAVTYRDPSGSCQGCEDSPAGLCDDHAGDLDRTDAYLALARDLGIEVDQ